MLRALRGAVGRIPVVGPAVRYAYLTFVEGEGRARPIRSGPLAGMKYYRYRWSTPREDLVETNWADEAADAFVRLIPGKQRFFDVGANWGFYVLLAHKHRDAGCQIVAFEPHPRSARELQTQIDLNAVANATVVQSALSNQNGTIEFVDTGSAIGQTLAAVDRHFVNSPRHQVPTMTLDAAAQRYGVPDLVKLDVEGAENLVLEGGRTVLTQHRPTLIVEVHGQERSGRFYDLMAEYGYSCQTATGLPIPDRAYHHHVVASPK